MSFTNVLVSVLILTKDNLLITSLILFFLVSILVVTNINKTSLLGLSKYLDNIFIFLSSKLLLDNPLPIITLLGVRKEIVSASSIKEVILSSSKS